MTPAQLAADFGGRRAYRQVVEVMLVCVRSSLHSLVLALQIVRHTEGFGHFVIGVVVRSAPASSTLFGLVDATSQNCGGFAASFSRGLARKNVALSFHRILGAAEYRPNSSRSVRTSSVVSLPTRHRLQPLGELSVVARGLNRVLGTLSRVWLLPGGACPTDPRQEAFFGRLGLVGASQSRRACAHDRDPTRSGAAWQDVLRKRG